MQRIGVRLGVALFALAGCSDEQFATATSSVMGGTDVPAGKWPDVAAVLFDGAQGCTGTLIAPDLVLSAGHCNESSVQSVVVGTHTLADLSAGETIGVKRRIEYPSSQRSLDILLLELQSPSTIRPRPLATGWARFDLVDGATAAIVGFGAVDQYASQWVDELQEATTTITDADCSAMSGCNAAAKPAGELGAGGMGVDTCPGDSGGPLYLVTAYGAFLAGVTSRAYDDAELPCRDGGIYARPDKIVDWIETQTGARLLGGPQPEALPILLERGHRGTTTIVHGDPLSDVHSFTLKREPMHGTVKILDDGRVRYCATPGDPATTDEMIVTVTDPANTKRALDVRIPIEIREGTPAGAACDLDAEDPPPPGEENPDGNNPDGDGTDDEPGESGGCTTTGGTSGLVFGLALLVSRRRRTTRA